MNTRTTILRAAEAVIRRDGVRAMTLESVAAEAGVSKGGLLYHFPSKRDLISAMAAGRIDEVASAVRACYREDPSRGVTGAYVASIDTAPLTELDLTLLAVVDEDPELLAPYREGLDRMHRSMTDEAGDPALATIVRLAADGLFFAELLGFGALDQDARSAVVARLGRLADEAVGFEGDA